jgi:excisionase family DNA binding protein
MISSNGGISSGDEGDSGEGSGEVTFLGGAIPPSLPAEEDVAAELEATAGLPEGEMLSLAELAEYLGKSRQTIYQWRSRGNFPFRTYGSGKSLRVARSEVDAHLASLGEAPPARVQPRVQPRVRSSGTALQIELAEGTNLSEVAEALKRIRAGAEVSVVLSEHGCVMRID